MVKKDEADWGRFELRMPPELLEVIDAWRRREPDLPNRSEAIRRLVEIGAGVKAEKRPRK
jgi:hypothetical protein